MSNPTDQTALFAIALSIVSVIVAVASAVIGALSYRENRRMATANETMAETNKSMAVAAEQSALTARDAVEDQRRELLLDRKGCLAVATDMKVGGISFSSQEGGWETTLIVYVRNEGREWAYNVEGYLTFDGKTGTTYLSRHHAIGPGNVDEFEFYFPFRLKEYDDMPFDSQAYFEFRADYRDGVGSDSATTRFRFKESTHPTAESGFPYWDTLIGPDDTQRSELCKPLTAI